jgi:hypothetical protein
MSFGERRSGVTRFTRAPSEGRGPGPRGCRSLTTREKPRSEGTLPLSAGSGDGEPACRRGSVRPLARGEGGVVVIHLSGLPGDGVSGETPGGPPCPSLGLAPGGVYRAGRVTPTAGALLPHRFTLACAGRGPPSAVCSLWHFPAGHPDWRLASTLPCGAPTFLDAVSVGTDPSRDHPADSPSRQ